MSISNSPFSKNIPHIIGGSSHWEERGVIPSLLTVGTRRKLRPQSAGSRAARVVTYRPRIARSWHPQPHIFVFRRGDLNQLIQNRVIELLHQAVLARSFASCVFKGENSEGRQRPGVVIRDLRHIRLQKTTTRRMIAFFISYLPSEVLDFFWRLVLPLIPSVGRAFPPGRMSRMIKMAMQVAVTMPHHCRTHDLPGDGSATEAMASGRTPE